MDDNNIGYTVCVWSQDHDDLVAEYDLDCDEVQFRKLLDLPVDDPAIYCYPADRNTAVEAVNVYAVENRVFAYNDESYMFTIEAFAK